MFVTGKLAMKIDGNWNFPENLAQFGCDLIQAVAVPPMRAEVSGGRL